MKSSICCLRSVNRPGEFSKRPGAAGPAVRGKEVPVLPAAKAQMVETPEIK